MSVAQGSSFIDIGSGFGKPVFHSAMQTGCPSYGVEVVPIRVSFCIDQKYSIIDHYAGLKESKPERPRDTKADRKEEAEQNKKQYMQMQKVLS